LGGKPTLAGTTSVEVALEVVLAEAEPGGTTVDHHADTGAVALAPG
jgi:hypothetical protein